MLGPYHHHYLQRFLSVILKRVHTCMNAKCIRLYYLRKTVGGAPAPTPESLLQQRCRALRDEIIFAKNKRGFSGQPLQLAS